MSRIITTMAVAIAVMATAPLAAKDKVANTYVVVNPDVGVPVFPNDITNRTYQVVGEVKTEVRKATIFSKEASQEKIYRELWERGEKLGADAVINAKYGDSRVTLMSWGSTAATGTAIKFVATPAAPAEAAATEAAVEASAAVVAPAAVEAPAAATAPASVEAPAPAEPVTTAEKAAEVPN